MGIRLFSIGRPGQIGEVYILKAIKYIFLADVTFLFCVEEKGQGDVILNQLLLAGSILLMYFIGKLQQSQRRFLVFQVMGKGMMQPENTFNRLGEIIVISLGMLVFALLYFFPDKAFNPVSTWFHDSIISIEGAFLFGFIFKIIGFFFMISMIARLINAFIFVISGGRPPGSNPAHQQNGNDSFHGDDYDDFEEIK